ncbi:hypothetical protein GCM10010278_66000 [Streptomyces melanogenes]|nr:hypothetical protein GCM10010278_66000 [Streptomyces melanogenes]
MRVSGWLLFGAAAVLGAGMDPVTMAAGSALVAAMATDAWQQARDGVVALWRRVHPERADQVGGELETLRTQVLQARQNQDPDTEQALEGMWRLQLQALLQRDPQASDELFRLLRDRLTPALNPGERERVGAIIQNSTVYGGTNFNIGGNYYDNKGTASPKD